MNAVHPNPITQQCSARTASCRINREDAQLQIRIAQFKATHQFIYQRTLAGTARSGNPQNGWPDTGLFSNFLA